MLFCSPNLGCTHWCGECTHKQNMDIGKPRVTHSSDISGDMSLRDACLGKPRVCAKDLSPLSNVDSRRKGSSGKGMKGGFKGAHKTITRKAHFDVLMDIRQLRSTCTSLGMFERAMSSEKILLCLMNLYIRFLIINNSRTDEKFVIVKLMSRGRSIISLPKRSWETSTRREFLQLVNNCKKEFKFITQYKYHNWMLQTLSGWILIIRGWWVTVQNCAWKLRIFQAFTRFEQRWNEGQTF